MSAQTYAAAIEALDLAVGTPEFDDAQRDCHLACEACRCAKEAIHRHIVEHGC
ncbi:MAG TPA: hypothetical protein VFA04_12175 [Bryobacteraceae bacterium]|nr:hypothetical protein [Bryobacteraceae bacterium]